MQQLNTFWLHSNCPVKFKLIAADAVIRTKLLYGMDSAQLGEPELKRINVVQLQILSKILGMKTTFIDRENSNRKIWNDVNTKLTAEGKKRQITSFKQAYAKAKLKMMANILVDKSGLKHKAIFNANLEERVYANRRVGRPKATWTETSIKDMWEGVRNSNSEWRHTKLDMKKTDIRKQLERTAKEHLDK